MPEIDMDETLYELTGRYPGLIDILVEMGFVGVKNPVIRKTLGRKTTLREGCKKQKKNLENVVKTLEEKGYTVKF